MSRIPTSPGLTADVAVRQNEYTEGPGHNTQYDAFVGTQMDNGLGVALLYSGMTGSEWRARSDERIDDVSLKWRYELTSTSEGYGKISWSVRGIYEGYAGWFGGDPADMFPKGRESVSKDVVELAGGGKALADRAMKLIAMPRVTALHTTAARPASLAGSSVASNDSASGTQMRMLNVMTRR